MSNNFHERRSPDFFINKIAPTALNIEAHRADFLIDEHVRMGFLRGVALISWYIRNRTYGAHKQS